MELFEAVRILIILALSFSVALFITPLVYVILVKFKLKKNNIRDEKSAPIFYKIHKGKFKTPTMAGIIIWATVIGLALVFFILTHLIDGFAGYFNFVSRSQTYLPLATLLLTAIVGMIDDMFGIMGKGPKGGGLKVSHKILVYTAIATIGAWWFYFKLQWDILYVPFIGYFDIGIWYIPFFIFVLVATAFSANEADGLDGLSGGIFLFAFSAFAVVSFVMGKFDLTAMIAAIIGGLLAFLWFNIYPAKFFMGDTGSMSLGITLGMIAMLTNSALFLPFFAFMLVVESLSVILQMLSKKIKGKKLFHSTPIHHHFEALGWPESQVTMRFWIISAVAATLGLVIFFIAQFA